MEESESGDNTRVLRMVDESSSRSKLGSEMVSVHG